MEPRKDLLMKSLYAFALVLLLIAAGGLLDAQVVNGINGTVVDTTGAVIPGAHVSATNTATGVKAEAITSSAGTFTIVGLNPGKYIVVVAAEKFKSVQTNVTVEVAKMSAATFTLTPGAVTELVTVKASAMSLNTTSPALGTTLSPELVKTAPIEINSLARQIDSFMFLAPGVQGTAGSHNINGGVSYMNEVQFNGVPVAFVDYAGNQTYINPPYEAVNEFRVNSSTFDARYGLGQGAVTYNMASGANQFHGDGFEILRNQLFDSDGFFPTHFSADGHPAPPVYQQNNYGFTISGPVILPKLYNGRNRTFFLFSSDWFRQNQAQNGIGTVPTEAMKNGDFSGFVDSSGALIPIYDPQTGEPFPGNIIPPGRISSISQSVLSAIPNPDRPGLNSGLQSNKSPAVASLAISQHLWSYTIDHNLSSSQSIHFSQWRDTVNSPNFNGPPIVPMSNELQNGATNTNLGSGFLLNYVKTVSSNLVVTAGADWIGLLSDTRNANSNVNFAGVANATTFPLVTFDGENAPTGWGVPGGNYEECCEAGLTEIDSRKLGVVVVNNWLWTKGRNTFNFGGQFRRTMQDILACQFCAGTFNFTQRTTSTPDSNDPNFGNYGSSFASFLLGLPDSALRAFAEEAKLRNKEFAFYGQDDIKLSKRLTINAGLRWDIMVPFTEDHNQIVYMDPTIPNPGAGGRLGAATKFGNCAGCAGVTRAAIHWGNFQPRFGFSYLLNDKTVLQAGYYLTYLDTGAYEYGTALSADSMSSLQDGQFLRGSTGTNVPAYGSWDAMPLPAPQAVSFSPSLGVAGVIFSFNPKKDGMAAYDQNWTVSVQRQLPWNMFMTVAYVGNRAIHLPTTLSLPNQPNPSVLQYGSLLGESVTSPDAVAAGIQVPYPEFVDQFGASATVEQALTPFPQYGGYFPSNNEQDGTAFYNAFQVQAEKRFSNGLSYLADVTLSRNMANAVTGSAQYAPNGINAFNQAPEYSPSSLDQKYVTNFVATYQLPIGPGQRYLNSKGLMSQVLGGWQISGILTYAGGNPMGPYNYYNPLLVNSTDRPNILPGAKLSTFSYSRSKDFFTGKSSAQPIQVTTDAFQNTGPWEVGDAKRSYAALRTPPLRIENFDVIKSFHLTERLRASLRVDYFNAFNRTQLQGPDMNSLDSTFGQITDLSSQISNRQGQATFRIEF